MQIPFYNIKYKCFFIIQNTAVLPPSLLHYINVVTASGKGNQEVYILAKALCLIKIPYYEGKREIHWGINSDRIE